MKIAVTSQNRKTVTGHAGKCRKFWVYDTAGAEILDKTLLELPLEQSFHAAHGVSHPLDHVNVLISGGMGMGLQQRLKHKGILAVVTTETDPDQAVKAWLNGTLAEVPPAAHGHEHPLHHPHQP